MEGTMKKAGLVDMPIPQPFEDWALVKVHSVPMCTEYKMFLSGKESKALGHEGAGGVIEVAQPCGVEIIFDPREDNLVEKIKAQTNDGLE